MILARPKLKKAIMFKSAFYNVIIFGRAEVEKYYMS